MLGPVKTLILDGLAAEILDDSATPFFAKHGITTVYRRNQDVSLVGLRGTLLRCALQATAEQLRQDGLRAPAADLLAAVTLAGNAFAESGGGNRADGSGARRPLALQDLLVTPAPAGDADHGVQRLRELALIAAVEATTILRVRRAAGALVSHSCAAEGVAPPDSSPRPDRRGTSSPDTPDSSDWASDSYRIPARRARGLRPDLLA